MTPHPTHAETLPDTVAVLQLNCCRSHNITSSLFNDPHVFNFLAVALQEPPVKAHTNLPSQHKGSHLIVHHPSSVKDKSRPRSCLYVNTRTNPVIQPLHSNSRDLSACTIQVQGLEILLVNVYNQPRTFTGFEAMDATLRRLPHSILRSPTIVVTDSNLHSPLWNPTSHLNHEASADSLVEAMTKWDLYLRSPKGVITFHSTSDSSCGTTIDLVWVNQQADDVLITCVVDEDDLLNHHSDHRASGRWWCGRSAIWSA